MEKSRLLYISPVIPAFGGTGIQQRAHLFLSALSKIGDVTLICKIRKDSPWGKTELEDFASKIITIPNTSFDWNKRIYGLSKFNSRILKTLPSLLTRRPSLLWRTRSDILSQHLKQLNWEDYDAVHVARLAMFAAADYEFSGKKKRKALICLDLDDIESEAFRRTIPFASNKPSTTLGKYLQRADGLRLQAYENEAIEQMDACIVCSAEDRDKLIKRVPSADIWTIPNSIDLQYYVPRETPGSATSDLYFIGTMDYLPNIDAVKHFVTEIFPMVRASIPDARFIIIGKNPTQEILSLDNGQNVLIIPDVPDTRIYHSRHMVFVAPIRFGGGTRIKILEAMAMQKCVVSFPVGAEGIPALDGKQIMIAGNPSEFAAKCILLLKNSDLRNRLSANARKFVSDHFDFAAAESKIISHYESLLTRSRLN
jgi:glycosyltransferase involved in cell wall biosynthesis